MTSALIYGGGCIGAITSHLLRSLEDEVAVVCRSNFEEVKQSGFIVNSTCWGDNLQSRPNVFKTVGEAVENREAAFDYVFVAIKTSVNADSEIEALRAAISPLTTIVLLQNGIAIEEPWHAVFPSNPIISTVLYIPVTQTSPNTFTHVLYDHMEIGTSPAESPRHHKDAAERLKDIMERGGAKVTHAQDIQTCRWAKLLINASENPICALSKLPDATFFRTSPGAIPFIKDVMHEVAAVARATGCIGIDDTVVQTQLDFITARAMPGVIPSMLSDVQAGRRVEVDAILGNVLRKAEEHGVDVPRLSTLYYLINGLNQNLGG